MWYPGQTATGPTMQDTPPTLWTRFNLVKNWRMLLSWDPISLGTVVSTNRWGKISFFITVVSWSCSSSRCYTLWLLSEQSFRPGLSPTIIHPSQNSSQVLTAKLDVLCLWTSSSWSIQHGCYKAENGSVTHCKWLMYPFRLVQWLGWPTQYQDLQRKERKQKHFNETTWFFVHLALTSNPFTHLGLQTGC